MVAVVALVLTACGPKASTGVTGEASILGESPTADGLTQQVLDLNGDQTADVYNFYRERSGAPRLLVRKETDLNWDGRIDVRTYFNEVGTIEREEMDGDFDSVVDWVDHYQTGRRVMSEVDTDYNGKFDLFKYYEAGAVRRRERDSNGDGTVDLWEYFDDQGKVTKTGKDLDGDGLMDVRQE